MIGSDRTGNLNQNNLKVLLGLADQKSAFKIFIGIANIRLFMISNDDRSRFHCARDSAK